MKKVWLIPAALSSMFLPGGAFAAVYSFTSAETSALGDPTYSFQLDTAKAVSAGGVTTFSDVTVDRDGQVASGQTLSLLNADEALASPSFFFIDTDVPGPKPFAVGSGADTTFNVGTFSIADGVTDGEGSLAISEAAVSPAPEPATWLTMIAGLAIAGLQFRRSWLQGRRHTRA